MITNIDEFERIKPKETYKAIQDLEKYVQAMLDSKELWHPNDTVEEIAKKIKVVKKTFIKGE
jgi:hypothetical protein